MSTELEAFNFSRNDKTRLFGQWALEWGGGLISMNTIQNGTRWGGGKEVEGNVFGSCVVQDG